VQKLQARLSLIIVTPHKTARETLFPFEVDISDYVQVGKNTLKVEVANLWVNRRVGDVKFPGDFPGKGEKQFETWASETKNLMHFTKGAVDDVYADDELIPSGLIGPVQLKTIQILPIKN